MDSAFTAGIAVTAVGVVAYATGTVVAYPGRSFSLTAVMVGLTLAAIEGANGRGGEGVTVQAVVTGTEGVEPYEDRQAAREAYRTTWMDLTAPTDDELVTVSDAFGLDPSR